MMYDPENPDKKVAVVGGGGNDNDFRQGDTRGDGISDCDNDSTSSSVDYNETNDDFIPPSNDNDKNNNKNFRMRLKKKLNNTNKSTDTTTNVAVNTKTRNEVRQVKIVIFLVLLISIAGAIAVFVYTKNSENEQFVNQFEDDANKVLGSLLGSMERRLGAFNNMATFIVTMAQTANETFPFVRVKNFAAIAGRTLQLTNAIKTAYTPVVKPQLRRKFERYTSLLDNNSESVAWNILNETYDLQRHYPQFEGPLWDNYTIRISDSIYDDYGVIPYNVSRIFTPTVHGFPFSLHTYAPFNYDWSTLIDRDVFNKLMEEKKAYVSGTHMIDNPTDPDIVATNELWCKYYREYLPADEPCLEPIAFWYYPVLDKINYIDVTLNPQYPDEYEVKAFLVAEIFWKHLLRDILPPNSRGVVIVFQYQLNNDTFTYQIDGPNTNYLGGGDQHDPKYDSLCIRRDLFDLDSYRIGKSEYFGLPIYLDGNNTYTLYVYPSDEMKDRFTTNKPIVFAVSAVAFILFPFLVFLVYDHIMTRQHEEIVQTANRSNAIVSSLFPSNIRDKLFTTQDGSDMINNNGLLSLTIDENKKSSLPRLTGPPIAELYTDTTVLFCDIADFTKWSSVRDPAQVFTLLESLYGSFDIIATRRNVFKVETIGDCYVAVAGVPNPQRDHAEVMARFAHDILRKMSHVTAELGIVLGPGTSTLQMRVGLNSGPTTAGVLRGANCRFQLFGDTVNTAARMESKSIPGKILCSQKTADILIAAGKERWITPRESLVDAKGKGFMQCYWITIKKTGSVCSVHSNDSGARLVLAGPREKEYQTVRWIAEMIESLLRQVVAQRDTHSTLNSATIVGKPMVCPLDEVSEFIIFPNSSSCCPLNDFSTITIGDSVREQIHEYVHNIAKLYQNNPFHNFTHASHVVMAARKLLNRVIKPTEGCASNTAYGISSDPLSQFAIVFSALIHDVDHPGVSNQQLVKEKDPIALRYHNKSAAEQNSVQLAWDLLMEPQFSDFRNLIMATEADSQRFRNLIINSVMATDLFDADLKQLRESRWLRVFDMENNDMKTEKNMTDDNNRRATIIIEHIIQASDVSHTMQHWHVYQEWNLRLFNELYNAYRQGRVEKDPSIGWYEGELWFFDNYIIPLAKKLETCGVFGVSCGELLDYAHDNRAEWAVKGRDIVTENVRLAQENINANCDQGAGTATWTSGVNDVLSSFISEDNRK